MPNFPPDFKPSHSHDNIALDTATKRLWLRDGSRERIFQRSDIVSWGFESNSMQGLPTQVMGGMVRQGTTVKYNSRIAIQTKDIDHPVYRIAFKKYNDFFFAPKNVADANAWAERLTAFMNM